jgi:hypothetical protein
VLLWLKGKFSQQINQQRIELVFTTGFFMFSIRVTPDGREAVMRLSKGDMRSCLNILQVSQIIANSVLKSLSLHSTDFVPSLPLWLTMKPQKLQCIYAQESHCLLIFILFSKHCSIKISNPHSPVSQFPIVSFKASWLLGTIFLI